MWRVEGGGNGRGFIIVMGDGKGAGDYVDG